MRLIDEISPKYIIRITHPYNKKRDRSHKLDEWQHVKITIHTSVTRKIKKKEDSPSSRIMNLLIQ